MRRSRPPAPFLQAAVLGGSHDLDASFRRVFPEGQVHHDPSAWISPLDLVDVWLGGDGALAGPPVQPSSPQRHVWVLAAHKGMGKSKAIRAAVRELTELCDSGGVAAPSVLNITFRRSLARGAAAEFTGGAVYLDIPPGTALDAARHPVLTVLINSLARVRSVARNAGTRRTSYDIVILDEWVSILEMLGGDLVDGDARLAILARLTEIMRLARAVIVSDALLDEASLRVLAEMLRARNEMAEEGAAAAEEEEEAAESEHRTAVTLFHYTHPNHADHVFIAHRTEADWEKALMEAVSSSRRRVVVPCMTKAAALRLSDRLRRSGREVLTYVAGGGRDVQRDMEQIESVWQQADVLVYSPVITAGPSFEVRGHFDECFLYAYQGTASPRSALQMVFRVRDLAAKRIHVWISRGEDGWGDPVDAFLLAGCSEDGELPQPPASLLRVHDAVMRCHALREVEGRRCFSLCFWRLVVQTSARVQGTCEESVEEQLAVVEAATRRTEAALRSERTRLPSYRLWQLDDMASLGLLRWVEPLCHVPPGGTPPLAPFSQEYDPDEWHTAFLRTLLNNGGWCGFPSIEAGATASLPLLTAAREAAASCLVLGRIRDVVDAVLSMALPGPRWWMPGRDGVLQLAFVGRTRSDSPIALYVHTQSARITRNDLLSDVAVRALFGYAVADLMRGGFSACAGEGAELTSPRGPLHLIIASADASSVWRGRVSFVPTPHSPSLLLRYFDYDACRPAPLPGWDLDDERLVFDPAVHVAGVLQEVLQEPVRAPFSIRPVNPTALPRYGGSWRDPRSMLQALLISGSHALLILEDSGQTIALPCRPLSGVGYRAAISKSERA